MEKHAKDSKDQVVKSYEEESYMRLLCKLLGLSDKDNALARKEILKSDENK